MFRRSLRILIQTIEGKQLGLHKNFLILSFGVERLKYLLLGGGKTVEKLRISGDYVRSGETAEKLRISGDYGRRNSRGLLLTNLLMSR